jgi:hypothetical protein
MCRALDAVGCLLYDWGRIHFDSAPTVVINVSDGLVTDSPYKGVDLGSWHDRIAGIVTSQGGVKVFDVILATDTAQAILRPATDGSLVHPGWTVPQAATFLPGVEMRPWASSSWLTEEEDHTTSVFLRRSELADDQISATLINRRA